MHLLKRLWLKFRLWKQPWIIGWDYGMRKGDCTCTVHSKWLDGVCYVERIEYQEPAEPTQPSGEGDK